MAFIAQCVCGKSFKAKPELAGKRVKCPACGQPLQIPAASTATPAPQSASQSKIAVTCRCGSRFQAPPNLAGKQVACPNCKQPLAIPATHANNDAFSDDPLGDLGGFMDPFAKSATPVAGGVSPTYSATSAQRPANAKVKSSGIPNVILYSVGGIFGVIFLGCAGLFITAAVTGVKQGIDNANGVWKPHVSHTGGYIVMLPGRVIVKNRTAEFGNFTAPAEDVYATAVNGDAIAITVCYDMPDQKAGAKSWAETYADAVEIDFSQVDRSQETFAGQQATHLRGNLKFEGQSTNQQRWILMGRDRFYDVTVSNAVNAPKEETVANVVKSFRLMPGSEPLSASSTIVENPVDRARKAAAGEWSTFDSDSYFTIDLPPEVGMSPPTVSNETLHAIEGRPDLVYYEREPRGKNYKFKVGYTRQLVQQPNESAEQVLDRFTAMFRPENNQVLETTVDSEKVIQHGQSPGREIAFGWSSGRASGNSRVRLYLKDRRIFWLECITVPGQPFPSSDFERLCTSFQPKSAN